MVNKTDSNDHDPTDNKRRHSTSVTEPYRRSSTEEIYMSFKHILKKFIYIQVFRQNTVAFEQQEAAKCSPEADSKLFHATCDELHKLFDVIVTLKEEGAASEGVQ